MRVIVDGVETINHPPIANAGAVKLISPGIMGTFIISFPLILVCKWQKTLATEWGILSCMNKRQL
jgi:hypothetical protein